MKADGKISIKSSVIAEKRKELHRKFGDCLRFSAIIQKSIP